MVGLLLLAAAITVLGERSTSIEHLEHAVSDGRVHSVEIMGGLPVGEEGNATQDVRWREGLFRYRAEVTQVSAGSDQSTTDGANGTEVRRADLGSELAQRQPGLRVDRGQWMTDSWQVLRWRVPGWLMLLCFVEGLTTFALLVRGPEPWRATRWAWFWLLSNPIGVLAFLVLSGPTPTVPPPKHLARRLTGGWAFLLSLIFAPIG